MLLLVVLLDPPRVFEHLLAPTDRTDNIVLQGVSRQANNGVQFRVQMSKEASNAKLRSPSIQRTGTYRVLTLTFAAAGASADLAEDVADLVDDAAGFVRTSGSAGGGREGVALGCVEVGNSS